MATVSDEGKESRALTALTELYCNSVEQPSREELDHGLDQLLDRVACGRAVRRKRWAWSLVGAAAALGVLVALPVASLWRKHLSPPELPMLSYRIDGGSEMEGGYLRENGHAGMKVLFNEGSNVALTPGTRGRIRAVDREGAHVAIERGTASFQVTRAAGRRWLVDVGPFLVTVKGTAFTVAWDPLGEQFELRLHHGRVVVSGPVSAGEIALREGQRLLVNLARAETMITEEAQERPTGLSGAPALPVAPSPPAAEAPAPSNEPAQPRLSAPSATSRSAKNDVGRGWGEELARGHWDRILADVKRMGVETTLGRASCEELFAVAHAARYRHRLDLARAALLAARRRFPDSPRALDAVFLLGRVDEVDERGMAQALAWYDEYLARAAKGPLVGEALGRKMTLTDKLQGAARARPIAEDYLRRFPKGSYAGSARALLASP